MYKEVDRNLNLTDVVSRVRFLKYDRLTKVMVYGWKDKIMTDKLMHALSTMTEIALLWNPCSDLSLMDREPYVLPHVCPQKPTPSPPTTDTIALLSEQQRVSSAPVTSTHVRTTAQPSYKRARHACDGLEEFSGGQSHH